MNGGNKNFESRAEQSRAEQSRAEQSRAEQSRAEQSLNCIKGVAVVLVVLGHCIQFGMGAEYVKSGAYYSNPVFKLIYSVHMPLFAAVSGYLFRWSVGKRNAARVLMRRFKSILIPCIAWSLTLKGMSLAMDLAKGQKLEILSLPELIMYCLTHWWFLWGILLCSVMVVMVRELFRDSITAYIVFGLFLLFLPDVLDFYLYIYIYPYFVLGYLFHRYKENSYGKQRRSVIMPNKMKNILTVSSIFLWFIMLFIFNKGHYIYISKISLLGKDILVQTGIDIFRWAIGAVGVCAVLLILSYVENYRSLITKFICNLGTKSLGMYTLGLILIQYFLQSMTTGFQMNYGIAVAETLLILMFSYGIELCMEKISLLKRIYLGGW